MSVLQFLNNIVENWTRLITIYDYRQILICMGQFKGKVVMRVKMNFDVDWCVLTEIAKIEEHWRGLMWINKHGKPSTSIAHWWITRTGLESHWSLMYWRFKQEIRQTAEGKHRSNRTPNPWHSVVLWCFHAEIESEKFLVQQHGKQRQHRTCCL